MVSDRHHAARLKTPASHLVLAASVVLFWTGVVRAEALGGVGTAAQAKPAPKATPQAAKPAAKPASKPAAKPAAKPPAASTAKAAKPAAAKKAVAKAKPAKKPAAKPAPARPPVPAVTAGMRDPFKIPVITPGPALPDGSKGPGGVSRGLVISELRLEGIVRQDTTNQMIAVVAGAANRAYFLRENDAVYNGLVAKITLDPASVHFKENFLDPAGKMSSREVVKQMPASGEK